MNPPRGTHPPAARRPRVPALLAAAWWLVPAQAPAHPVSITDGVLHLGENETVLELRVLCEDFFLYHHLAAGSDNRLAAAGLAAAAKAHVEFLARHLYLLDADGGRLNAVVTLAQPPALPSGGVPVDQLMEHAASYRIAWPTARRPALLTFMQDFGGEDAYVPAIMRVAVHRGGVETDYAAQLEKKRPLTLRTDWGRPPVPLTADLRRRREQERREEQAAMGLPSYGSIYSFLYLERYAVRHEILVPLMALDSFLQIPRDQDFNIGVAEQDALKPTISKLFRVRNRFRIDGIEVTPAVDRIDFYGLDFKDFAMRAPRRPLNLASARMGVILTYPALGSFRRAELNWDLFTEHITTVRSTVFTDESARQVRFSLYQSRFEWENPQPGAPPPPGDVPAPGPPPPWRVPWLSLLALAGIAAAAALRGERRPGWKAAAASVALAALAIGAWRPVRVAVADPFRAPPAPDAEGSRAVTAALLRNIYRAFEYHDEGEIHDALARSADGELLHRLYLMIQRGRVMEEQGGAVSRIREVRLVDGRPGGRPAGDPAQPAFSCVADWAVTGTVEHWGHVHERTHRYRARLEVRAVGGAWKITGLEVLDEQRLNYTTRLREA